MNDAVVFLVAVALLLALAAGAGWGVALTYQRMRPEAVLERTESTALRAVAEMQASQSQAITQLVDAVQRAEAGSTSRRIGPPPGVREIG